MALNEKKYFRGSIESVRVEEDKKGKKSIIFKTGHSGQTADFSDPKNLMDIAFNARKNANNLYDLVMEKYTGNNPVDLPGYEMLIALVNLSSELYMKSIIYYYQRNHGKQCRGLHKLEDYFSKLPDDIQSKLKTIDINFETQLKDISNYFNEFRYSFEFNWISSKEFSFSLAKKLNQICNEIEMQQPAEVVWSDSKFLVRQGKMSVCYSFPNHRKDDPVIAEDD